MKTYNKEKLNEYAKELFALCLRKDINFSYNKHSNVIIIYIGIVSIRNMRTCYLSEDLFNYNSKGNLPIWELIEEVKVL